MIEIIIYHENKKWEYFFKYLSSMKEPVHVITDNGTVHNHLREMGQQSSLFDLVVPETGDTVWEVYNYSKKVLEEYRQAFRQIKQSEVEVFSCLDFSFFRQIHYLARLKRVIEQEKRSIVFLFFRFFPIFFALNDITSNSCKSRIGFLRNGNIEFLENVNDTKQIVTKMKVISFIRSSIYKKNFMKNSLYISKYLIDSLKQKTRSNTQGIDYFKYLENNRQSLEKKIIKFMKNKIEIVFFVSGSREDLYIQPLKKIFEKLDNENIGYLVVTNNISTSLVLTNNKIQHINLDATIKTLAKQFKISNEGKKILDTIDGLVNENPQLIGIKELKNFISETILETIVTLQIVEFIVKLNPRSVYAGLDGEILENSAINLARKYGISSFSMLPSLTNPSPVVKEWFHAEKIFVPGELGFDLLKKLGYDDGRLVITGHPKYDFLKKISSKDSKAKLKKEFNFEQKNKIITIAMSQWNEDDEKWMSEFIKFCNDNNYEIIIKIHPMYKATNTELDINKIESIKRLCAGNKFWITHDTDIYSLLSASDLIITDYSNVGVEGKILGKPIITINFVPTPWNYLQLEETGAALAVKNIDDLKTITKKTLKSDYECRKEEFDFIVSKYNYKNDGRASERIINFLLDRN